MPRQNSSPTPIFPSNPISQTYLIFEKLSHVSPNKLLVNIFSSIKRSRNTELFLITSFFMIQSMSSYLYIPHFVHIKHVVRWAGNENLCSD